jgi:hypothetical protein
MIDSYYCSEAAQKGQFEHLKWLRKCGCPWDESTCSAAARGGHLNILKWAKEQGCPWDSGTYIGAAAGGHLNILKWAKEQGYFQSVGVCMQTMACIKQSNGIISIKHSEIILWLVDIGSEYWKYSNKIQYYHELINILVKRFVKNLFTNVKTNCAASVIQKKWLGHYYDPESSIGKRRLLRQFDELGM